jgi:hypothetical protein
MSCCASCKRQAVLWRIGQNVRVRAWDMHADFQPVANREKHNKDTGNIYEDRNRMRG